MCSNGWSQWGGACYYFSDANSDDELAWSDAYQRCLTYSSNLICVNSSAENTFIASNLDESSRRSVSDEAWIGYTDSAAEGHFVWSTGSTCTSTFTHWYEGEPNDGGQGGSDCARILSTSYWRDWQCSAELPFICKGTSSSIAIYSPTASPVAANVVSCANMHVCVPWWSAAPFHCPPRLCTAITRSAFYDGARLRFSSLGFLCCRGHGSPWEWDHHHQLRMCCLP
jgi:hypothetical protein